MIETERLRLVPATVRLARAELRNREEFAELLGAAVPRDWPPETVADALPFLLEQLEAGPQNTGWYNWYVLAREAREDDRILVASAGFKGPPQDGTVEIGYAVLPGFQGRGFATETAGALMRWAIEQGGVTRIVAETEWANPRSVRVLRKLGFQESGAGSEPDAVRFEVTVPR